MKNKLKDKAFIEVDGHVLIKDVDYSTLEIQSLETIKSFEFRNRLNLTSVMEKTVSDQFNRTLRQEQKVDSILTAFLK